MLRMDIECDLEGVVQEDVLATPMRRKEQCIQSAQLKFLYKQDPSYQGLADAFSLGVKIPLHCLPWVAIVGISCSCMY